MTRMAIYLARHIRLDGMAEFEREKELIRREVRADHRQGAGDGRRRRRASARVRGFESGVLDIPWSPNRHVKSRVMPARDADGALRILDPGAMPFPRDVLAVHEERLRKRAEREGVPFGHDLAVSSVYELSETLERLMPFRLKHG